MRTIPREEIHETKTFFAILALAVAALSGCWYYRPHLAMRSMQQAAEEGDADRPNEFVDHLRRARTSRAS